MRRRVFGLAVLVVVAAAGCGGDETTTVTVTEPATGVWITVEIDTVRAIDQQYRP